MLMDVVLPMEQKDDHKVRAKNGDLSPGRTGQKFLGSVTVVEGKTKMLGNNDEKISCRIEKIMVE